MREVLGFRNDTEFGMPVASWASAGRLIATRSRNANHAEVTRNRGALKSHIFLVECLLYIRKLRRALGAHQYLD